MSYHDAQASCALGTLVRANPLPPGRYWQDFFGDNRDRFALWLRKNASTVKAEVTESNEENGGGPARDFYIFSVKAPTPWDAVTFGFPTIATKAVQSSADTVQRPPPEQSGADTLQSAASGVARYAFYGMLAIGGLLAFRAVDTLGLLTGHKD